MGLCGVRDKRAVEQASFSQGGIDGPCHDREAKQQHFGCAEAKEHWLTDDANLAVPVAGLKLLDVQKLPVQRVHLRGPS